MTTPVTSSDSPNGVNPGSADPDSLNAVQRALAAEHAAGWALQLVTAYLPASLATALTEAATAHRAHRDAAIRLLRDRGVSAAPAQPAYLPLAPVTDTPSALALLITAETDVASAWRSALEHTDDAGVRALAAESLTDAAVRATRWRRAAKLTPLTVPFPGAP